MTTHTQRLICPTPDAAAALHPNRAAPVGERLTRLAGRLLATLVAWSERTRQRRVLAQMSDRELADIGLDRITADREANRPFWDI